MGRRSCILYTNISSCIVGWEEVYCGVGGVVAAVLVIGGAVAGVLLGRRRRILLN